MVLVTCASIFSEFLREFRLGYVLLNDRQEVSESTNADDERNEETIGLLENVTSDAQPTSGQQLARLRNVRLIFSKRFLQK